jgi:hypothetical protein
VSRLLRPPSEALAGSVTTAVPVGTRLRGISQSSSGVVTVDLVGGAVPQGQGAQDLSAQLVWTLGSMGASFRGLRLRVDGRALAVPGQGEVQDAAAWGSYDPDGLGPKPPYFYASDRRLASSTELPASPATAGRLGDGRAIPVDAVAVTPDRTRIALLGEAGGTTTVRVGPLRGNDFSLVARAAGLASPSWGSGQHGLWLLRDGRDVVRVQGRGLSPVTVLGLPAGRLSSLAVSRDGVRVALVVGGRLYVGRVELVHDLPRVVDLALVLPSVRGGTRVAWESSTQLLLLSRLAVGTQLLRVAVDGSSVTTVSTAGLEPSALAASPAGIVVVSHGQLFASTGGPVRRVESGRAAEPAFPG